MEHKFLHLTAAAAERIATFLEQDSKAKGFRVGIKKTGCSGWGYEVSLAYQIGDDELVCEDRGIHLITPKSALDKIKGTTIDYQKQGINQIFVYQNPNAVGECGCGESFTVS